MASEFSDLPGKILLAHPTLLDPNFRRAIVYLVSYDPLLGAFGFIINRPTQQLYSDLAFEKPDDIEVDAPLYVGGPVGTNRVMMARLEWDNEARRTEFTHTLPLKELEAWVAEESSEFLALIGYSGWGLGQLEAELKENSWVIMESDYDLRRADGKTWKRLIGSVNPTLRLLAELPDDPELN